MPLLRNILGAIRSAWNSRPAANRKTRRHVLTGMDHLDDRQLLTVSFTGNVINDFSTPSGAGVKFLTGGPKQVPSIPADLQPIIKVSGFQMDGVALSYDPGKDELFVGVLQPDNMKSGQKVIAGDSDNNLNSATVDPAITALPAYSNFQDYADLGADENIGVFIDLNNDGTADIMAGVKPSNIISANKPLVVTRADNSSNPPTFGTEIPGYAGNIYLVNNPAHPGFEFSIKNFKQLAQSQFGIDITNNSILAAGVTGQDAGTNGIGAGTYFAQAFNWKDVVPSSTLSITKVANPSPTRVGGTLVYTIYVQNTGDFTDPNVVATDIIPTGMNIVSVTPSQGTASLRPDGKGFDFNLGAIASKGSAAITIVAQPTAVNLTGAVNTVTATGQISPAVTATTSTQVLGPESCPPVKVNPIYAGVINTLHRGVIRGHVFGTNFLDTRTIDPSTVTLSSPLMASPVKVFQDTSGQYANFQRRLNGDPFVDRTFLFEANDPAFKTLPYGWTTLVVNGRTTTGETFASQAVVFNVNRGHWDKKIADRIVTAVSESAKHVPPPNYSVPSTSAAGLLKAAQAGLTGKSASANQQLTQTTVQIPFRNRAGQSVNVNYGTGAKTTQVRQANLAQPVQLGTSTVRIPISNGFGSPVVVNNASQVNSARRAPAGLNPTRTVKIARTATPTTRVRANISQSINDFLSQ